MGNGSMKSKRYKPTETSVSAANGQAHKERCSAHKTSSLDSLRARVDELEREGKRKDEELCAKEQQIKGLQEQLAKQTRVLSELSEELQNKCIQLNKLQDVLKSGAPTGLPSRPPSVKASGKSSPNLSVRIKETMNRRKGAKAGVSAEPTSSSLPKFSFEKARVPKDVSVKKLLTDALNKNQYLRRLELQQIKDMVECMYECTYQQGEYVIKQGEPGNHLFVLADGKLEVFQQNKLLTSIAVWTTFGELAILYNCTRTASVRAVNKVRTWALDREAFQNIMRRTAETRHEQYRNFLRSVSLLANLPDDKLSKIVDCLEVEYYDKGEYVIRQGEEGSTFYIIAQGKVNVTQINEAHKLPQIINTLQKGDYFGEKALISDDVRSANIIADENGVECLVIDRETFDHTVGNFNELQKHLEGYVATLDRDDKKRYTKKSVSRHQSQPLSPDFVQLKEMVSVFSSSRPFDHLEVISTLGVGGFGRVELVKVKGEDMTFALKMIKKKHVVENRQEEHIHSERRILAEARSSFIVKLYRTFRDNKYVYMLLEACLGGEIWSLLRDRGSFDEPTAKFCVGCVTEAFEYLHRKGVLYRDLKPENLMLDSEGYIKLVDFGFAKKIRSGQKTWTFCGTPEYVAPEIILNKGHNFSVDFWALGILVFELLTGSPPFSGSDQMMTYTFILKGIEKMDFPKKITRRPEDLIRKLCRRNPAERLGNLKNGITDIKKHRWFNGFNWDGLKARTLQSPLKRDLSGPTDHTYFDKYPPDEDSPPDELSGWDMDF
ncbi:PREDICTED: cGMP-dependent protein kinase 2 isoform X1 [Cyprinodon variegatus]|uniref:cGMP-dependent protein kinase 2 isoform X1 n=2 Tax=Cyprinodon variegatus TaxID=28743 RepID=UPI000742B883|nr:PREDICTED: cGMP-dependent protein kinase 2 isoform X1 [Cyprinodon variegatus]XP_015229078.1 PREDICTED: cGMP-dependent protein kinase 2 isoform X1 [Cyprinodon variegatus]XP_015229079.1 PREDICTED: cGMP-dependent protein kinase 2 isoform X1 [Cyprinodon variegatus]